MKMSKGNGSVVRWHIDSNFSQDTSAHPVGSYAVTLLGPPTWIADQSREFNRDLIKTVRSAPFGYHDSKNWPANQDERLRERIGDRQIYRFTANQKDSPVHTTPPHLEDRIFLLVNYAN